MGRALLIILACKRSLCPRQPENRPSGVRGGAPDDMTSAYPEQLACRSLMRLQGPPWRGEGAEHDSQTFCAS